MSKVKQFDKAFFKMIRAEVDAALKPLADKHGISLHMANVSFTNQTFTAKVEGAIVDSATGVAVTPEELALKNYHKSFLGDKFVMDAVYMYRGKKIKFVGLQTRSHKYPVIFQDLATGKKFKMESDVANKIIDPTYRTMDEIFNARDKSKGITA